MAEKWHLQVTLPDELRVKLTVQAIKNRTSKTAIVRRILEDALEHVEVPPDLLSDDEPIGDL